MSYLIGLDVGGTNVKGIVLKDGEPVFEASVPTGSGAGIVDRLESFAKELAAACGTDLRALRGVGVGFPGVVESAAGRVVRAPNLDLENYPLKALLEERLGVEVKTCNDANAAVLGEARFGAGRGYSDVALVTLGTGVGGGIIIGGKLFEGNRSAGAEIGHMVIAAGGRRCSCGRRGCFEAYCSARALTEFTRQSMEKNPSSLMWRTYTPDTADGAAAFRYMDADGAARKTVRRYLKYLACGIANIANVFRPQVIILGGGVSAQGDRLVRPLKELLKREIFCSDYAPVEIMCAALGNSAGALGAAALFL